MLYYKIFTTTLGRYHQHFHYAGLETEALGMGGGGGSVGKMLGV